MGFRFQKRIRILKGLTMNLSKSGTSWTVGAPGTGLSYLQRPMSIRPKHFEN
jgi:hypothetical protein